jgi:hypothetical protein
MATKCASIDAFFQGASIPCREPPGSDGIRYHLVIKGPGSLPILWDPIGRGMAISQPFPKVRLKTRTQWAMMPNLGNQEAREMGPRDGKRSSVLRSHAVV